MRRPALLALAAVLAAGCSTSPCQKLGEKLCSCTGLDATTCTTQVDNQLNHLNPPQATMDQCQVLLDRCNEPPGATFCQWLQTEDGKIACGLSPEPIGTTTP